MCRCGRVGVESPLVHGAVGDVVIHADVDVVVHGTEEQEHHAADDPGPDGPAQQLGAVGQQREREEQATEGGDSLQAAEEQRLEDGHVAEAAADRLFRQRGTELEAEKVMARAAMARRQRADETLVYVLLALK